MVLFLFMKVGVKNDNSPNENAKKTRSMNMSEKIVPI